MQCLNKTRDWIVEQVGEVLKFLQVMWPPAGRVARLKIIMALEIHQNEAWLPNVPRYSTLKAVGLLNVMTWPSPKTSPFGASSTSRFV